MPYFQWEGITLHAKTRHGKTFARNIQELDSFLFKRDIALMFVKQARMPLIGYRITTRNSIDFFHHVASLLSAGLLLPEALLVVQDQLSSPRLQEVVESLAVMVHEGCSLSEAVKRYPQLFDDFIVHMIHVGQETSSLSVALMLLATHLELVMHFRKKLREAALMPCLTMLFFGIVTLGIVVGIIPYFATLFASFGQELPLLTQWLIKASCFARSWYMVLTVVGIMLLSLAGKVYYRLKGKIVIDRACLKVPYIGRLMYSSNQVYFLRACALALDRGLSVPQSVMLAKKTLTNSYLQSRIEFIEQEIIMGNSLSGAMAQHPDQLFDQQLLSMIKVGEESGELSAMMYRTVALYEEEVKKSLTFITTIMQPLCVILIGLLITLLICAVYLPIIQLAQIVH